MQQKKFMHSINNSTLVQQSCCLGPSGGSGGERLNLKLGFLGQRAFSGGRSLGGRSLGCWGGLLGQPRQDPSSSTCRLSRGGTARIKINKLEKDVKKEGKKMPGL
jgi:hypothetical protein